LPPEDISSSPVDFVLWIWPDLNGNQSIQGMRDFDIKILKLSYQQYECLVGLHECPGSPDSVLVSTLILSLSVSEGLGLILPVTT
jgi:hypothetical protein